MEIKISDLTENDLGKLLYVIRDDGVVNFGELSGFSVNTPVTKGFITINYGRIHHDIRFDKIHKIFDNLKEFLAYFEYYIANKSDLGSFRTLTGGINICHSMH